MTVDETEGLSEDVPVTVGDALALGDGFVTIDKVKSWAATYNAPPLPITVVVLTGPPALYDHNNTPLSPLKLYTYESMLPMYTVPSLPIAGELTIASPHKYDHNTTPLTPSNAYK